MNQNSYYILTVTFTETNQYVYGLEETLQAAIDEWKEWNENPARNENTLLEIHAITNTIDRAAQHIIIKMELIQSMNICKL